MTDKQLVTGLSDQTWFAILLQNQYSALNLELRDLSFLILTNGPCALRSLMDKSRILEYMAVTGLWTALVYDLIHPLFPGRFSSATIFTLLVPLLIYWVLPERLLVWGDDDTDDK